MPYPDEEILSGDVEDVSFIRDGFATWVKADFNTILERHAVDIGKALADFREALHRKDSASTTGIQDFDMEEKALLRSKLLGNGTSSRCREQLSKLITSFSQTGPT